MFECFKIFLYATTIDVLWVLYILTTAKKQKLYSIVISMMLGLVAFLGIKSALTNNTLLFFYITGLGFGTYLGMVLKDKFIK